MSWFSKAVSSVDPSRAIKKAGRAVDAAVTRTIGAGATRVIGQALSTAAVAVTGGAAKFASPTLAARATEGFKLGAKGPSGAVQAAAVQAVAPAPRPPAAQSPPFAPASVSDAPAPFYSSGGGYAPPSGAPFVDDAHGPAGPAPTRPLAPTPDAAAPGVPTWLLLAGGAVVLLLIVRR